MNSEVHSTLQELSQLATSLSNELEEVLLQKQASDAKVETLQKQIDELRKQAEASKQEKVILEKVASHGIACPELIPVLGKLEKAGFIKAGSAMEAYAGIKRRPDHLIDLLTSIAESFSSDTFEGEIEKSAATTLPEGSKTTPYVDLDGWSRIITEGA